MDPADEVLLVVQGKISDPDKALDLGARVSTELPQYIHI
jgi:hypothetical protein